MSPRHLAEFWMLESELITEDVEDVIAEALALIKAIGLELLKYPELLKQIEIGLPARIEEKLKEDIKIISYKEASLLLGKPIQGSKEEKELMELLSSSIVLTDFPLDQKTFYMKQEDCVTKSFDILLRGVGEVVGGSLREKSAKLLKERMSQSLLETLGWYLDIRAVDEISTGGYGLGFERILMYYLDLDSIKDAIAFPRWMERMDM